MGKIKILVCLLTNHIHLPTLRTINYEEIQKMSKTMDKNQIIEEIGLIPEDKHKELYDLIHKFRMSLNQSENKISEIMQFAGSWSDISEEDFKSFAQEIEQRRQTSLSRRFSL